MIKHIVVHLTGSDEDAVRLAYAEPIARQFGAHLTGLLVHILPEIVTMADPTGAAMLQELIAQSEARAKETRAALEKKISALGISSELRLASRHDFSAGETLAAATRTADLFIGTRPYGDPTGRERIEEEVLFGSGRGCLFLPPKGTPPKSWGSVFVAWKETREAARAVAESLPFLRQARQVVVGVVEEAGAGEQARFESGADIGRYLSRHGISAEIRKIAGWDDTAEALANETKQIGADLIVMGGYGHSRFREWVLGGVTREFLSTASVPVLMAH